MFKPLRVSVLAALCLALIPALAPAQTPESEASYLPPAEAGCRAAHRGLWLEPSGGLGAY